MNYITALLLIGTFLMFTACGGGGGDGSSNENSNEPINEKNVQNTNSSQVIDQDNNESQTVEGDIQAVLGDNNFNNPYNDPNSDPYNHPYSNPYSDPNK